MRISFAQLKRHPARTLPLKLNRSLPPIEVLGLEVEFSGPAEVDGEMGLNETVLTVSGRIRADLVLSCGRCLEKYHLPLEVSFAERFVPVAHASEDEDLGEYRVYREDEVDLEPVVIENIILALPMQYLCSLDCRGICPNCGVNLNNQECHCLREEPEARFSVLSKLLPRNN